MFRIINWNLYLLAQQDFLFIFMFRIINQNLYFLVQQDWCNFLKVMGYGLFQKNPNKWLRVDSWGYRFSRDIKKRT